MKQAIRGGNCVEYFREFRVVYPAVRNEIDDTLRTLPSTMQFGFRIVMGLVQNKQYDSACAIMQLVPLDNFR